MLFFDGVHVSLDPRLHLTNLLLQFVSLILLLVEECLPSLGHVKLQAAWLGKPWRGLSLTARDKSYSHQVGKKMVAYKW